VRDSSKPSESGIGLKPSKKVDPVSRQPDLLEKEQSADYLSLPFETAFSEKKEDRSLPPFQSFAEPENVDSKADLAADAKETFEEQFSKNAAEAARALSESDGKSTHGIRPDGSMWWKETGVEQRPDGVVCKWTVIRGVSADGAVEWEWALQAGGILHQRDIAQQPPRQLLAATGQPQSKHSWERWIRR